MRAFSENSGVAKAAELRRGKTKYTDAGLAKMAITKSIANTGTHNPMYGKSHWHNKTEIEKKEIKKKTSETLKETYRKIPRKYKTTICPHCLKEGGAPNMTRYHFDNCIMRT